MHDDQDDSTSPPDDSPEDFLQVGGSVEECVVTLALYGEDLDPHEISTLLQCDATSAHRKGDSRPGTATPYSKGAWFLSLRGVAPRPPAELVRAILARVPDDAEVWNQLEQRFDIQLRFGLFQKAWNRGFDLPRDLVDEIARVRASLDFDLYMNGDE